MLTLATWEHILVNGEFCKRDFKMLDTAAVTQSELQRRFVEAARRIQPLVKECPTPPDKVFGVGEMGDGR